MRQTWGSNYIDFLYDESGLAYSFIYNDTQYYYVKNLQGDVMSIANDSGSIVVNYVYDAWGNILSTTGSMASTVGAVNPIRYRSYYYDGETGFYYLQSRYYDPAIRRFINADGYINANGDILGFNMYAYCGNNPVMGYDPTGEWNWSTFWSVTNVVLSAVAGVVAGVATGNVAVGIVTATLTYSGLNNVVNTVYYNHFSDGKSEIDNSSYQDGYIDRFERLDYTKERTEQEIYNSTAWTYYSEYNLHMCAWQWTGWAYNKDVFLFSYVAERSEKYDENIGKWDERWFVNLGTAWFCFWGQ